MAAVDTGNSGSGRGFGLTNSKLRKEIRDDIADEVGFISDVQRTADSIVTSANFHLDSRDMGGGDFKVDVQFKKGTKDTVAVVMVRSGATSTADLRTAINGSAASSTIWDVT